MTDLSEVLRYHGRRYPNMTPCDAVKLLYQNEFGGGHLVENQAASLAYLLSEYETLRIRRNTPVSEDIGNGYARLYLGCPETELAYAPYINRIFVLSSRRQDGSIPSFLGKLDTLQMCTEQGELPFSRDELREYLAAYHAAGLQPVSHSAAYREAYAPAYRVIDARYVRLLTAVRRIADLLEQKPNPVICIEGRAASGKSTAAALLAPLFDAQVIHMDDFFLPAELRTPGRYQEAGGNVHYERFQQEVVEGILQKKPFGYRVFDCGEMDYRETITVDPSRPVIIEGAYSMHPHFSNIYDLRIFSDIRPDLQRQRILERNGRELLRRFDEEWIPLEEQYFAACGIPDLWDIALE